MRRANVLAVICLPLLAGGCATTGTDAQPWIDLGTNVAKQIGGDREVEAANALREALGVASDRTATALGRAGGYTNDPRLHIALPDSFQPVAKALRNHGFGQYVDSLENDMNISAEIAAAKAAPVLRKSLAGLTPHDAQIIVQGDDTAGTRWFRQQAEGELQDTFRPAVQDGLRKTGFYDSYKTFLDKYRKLPFAEKPTLDLEQYVVDKTLNGLFTRLGEEEAAIRHDPAKRTTALLKNVFGANPGR